MHAHDRTLIASLGFADKDKQNPDHEKACQFLTQQEIAERFAFRCQREANRRDLKSARTEVAIMKGERQYKTTIGFIDVVLAFGTKVEVKESVFFWNDPWNVAIEVKIEKIPISDVIRQIVFYREWDFDDTYWFVATPWSITVDEMKLLDSRKIYHVLLGDAFEKFKNKPVVTAESDLTL